jgi:orotidine-5'-phosphate decarboxylase
MSVPERPTPALASAGTAVADPMHEARKRLIVALDVPDANSALHLAAQLEDTCQWFKVGLELFVSAGPQIVEPLLKRGYSIFLDLKFHDIPNTAGGPAMLAAAREALEGVENPPQLLAVTVLTSMDAAQTAAIGLDRSPASQVDLLARMAMAQGLRGFVTSPQEVAALRSLTGPEGVLVIPGIRPAGSGVGDQKRIATPADALRLGATYLVVGRPITQAPNPAQAANAILHQMAQAL